MFWALIGATVAVTRLLRWHDRPLRALRLSGSAIK